MLWIVLLLSVVSATEEGFNGFLESLTVGTWNTMRLPWMPDLDLVIKNILNRDLDVLALQEVWTPDVREQILKKVKHRYPHHYYSPPRAQEPVGCPMNAENPYINAYAGPFVLCSLQSGVNLSTIIQPYPTASDPATCGQLGVAIAWNYIEGSTNPIADSYRGQQCVACLANTLQNLPSNEASAYTALGACAQFAGNRFTLGGSNGQLILSKHPIRNVRNEEFNSFMFDRSNIYATIKGIKFAFGHWGYNIMEGYGPQFAPLQFGDVGINHAQKTVAAEVDVTLGDFNSGVNYQPEGYNYLLNNGFVDLVPQPLESWCPPSHLGWLPCINSGRYSAAIDHIMVRDDWRLKLSKFSGVWNEKPLMSDHVALSARIFKINFR